MTVHRFRLPRRAFLRGSLAAGATIWLPPLEAMFNRSGTALAQGGVLPKRFVFFWWGNSYSPWLDPSTKQTRVWLAPASGDLPTNLPLGMTLTGAMQSNIQDIYRTPSLSDADVRKWIQVVHGLTIEGLPSSNGSHRDCMMAVTTAAQAIEAVAKAPSLDQVIASFAAFRSAAARSIQLGVCPVENNGNMAPQNYEAQVSIRALDASGKDVNDAGTWSQLKHVRAEWDPATMFDRLFTSGDVGSGGSANAEAIAARKKSVLDGVIEGSSEIMGRMSASDRIAVEDHLEKVRELERSIAATSACTRPTKPGSAPKTNALDSARMSPQTAFNMRALLRIMFACDYTRVASYILNNTLGGMNFEFYNQNAKGNDASHHKNSHFDIPAHVRSVPWITGQLAAVIKDLSLAPEGAGKILDRTLIVAMSEHGPQLHSIKDIACIVAGGPTLVAGGRQTDVAQGRTASSAGTHRTMADFHLGVLKSLGINRTEHRGSTNPVLLGGTG